MIQKGVFYMIPFVLALLPFMTIFIGEETVPLTLITLGALLLFEKGKVQNFKKNKLVLGPFFIAVAIFVLYTILSPDFHLALKVLERQTSLLVIPLLIMLLNWSKKRIIVFHKCFTLLLFAVGISSIFFLLFFTMTNSDWISLVGEQNGSKLLYIQYKYPHIMGAHPTYWSYLLICGIIALLSKDGLRIYSSKYVLITLLIFFNLNMIFLAARTPLLINLLVHLLFINRLFVQHRSAFKFKLGVFLLLVAIVGSILKSPLLSGKLSMVQEDERFYNWKFAVETIKNNYYVLGEGLGQGNELIRRNIINTGDTRIRYTGYDLHNQYLRHYMDMGILGFLSLCILLVYPLFLVRKLTKVDKELYYSFFLLFSLGLMTESYMYRLKGIVFFSVVASILYLRAHRQIHL